MTAPCVAIVGSPAATERASTLLDGHGLATVSTGASADLLAAAGGSPLTPPPSPGTPERAPDLFRLARRAGASLNEALGPPERPVAWCEPGLASRAPPSGGRCWRDRCSASSAPASGNRGRGAASRPPALVGACARPLGPLRAGLARGAAGTAGLRPSARPGTRGERRLVRRPRALPPPTRCTRPGRRPPRLPARHRGPPPGSEAPTRPDPEPGGTTEPAEPARSGHFRFSPPSGGARRPRRRPRRTARDVRAAGAAARGRVVAGGPRRPRRGGERRTGARLGERQIEHPTGAPPHRRRRPRLGRRLPSRRRGPRSRPARRPRARPYPRNATRTSSPPLLAAGEGPPDDGPGPGRAAGASGRGGPTGDPRAASGR